MRTRSLAILLTLCALFAVWPAFPWLGARFDWLDARWLESLGTIAVFLPIGLAAAALVLVVHGLRVNQELYDLIEAADEDEEQQLAMAAAGVATSPNLVTVSGGTAVAQANPAAAADDQPTTRSNKMAVTERKNQGFKNKDGKRPKKVQRASKTIARRGSWAVRSGVRRKVRENMRMPRF